MVNVVYILEVCLIWRKDKVLKSLMNKIIVKMVKMVELFKRMIGCILLFIDD